MALYLGHRRAWHEPLPLRVTEHTARPLHERISQPEKAGRVAMQRREPAGCSCLAAALRWVERLHEGLDHSLREEV